MPRPGLNVEAIVYQVGSAQHEAERRLIADVLAWHEGYRREHQDLVRAMDGRYAGSAVDGLGRHEVLLFRSVEDYHAAMAAAEAAAGGEATNYPAEASR